MQADVEAMREIEARMVEILAERGVKIDGVIAADDVAAIKQTLGGSEEFADDDAAASEHAQNIDTEKKLMRDLDNAWVGGVGSGLAAYFGIDAMIVRVAMLILMVISFGTFIFIYLLLWLLVPPAKTAADKLRMRGKPVTLEALKDTSNANDGRTPAGRMIAVILRAFVAVMLGFVTLGILLGTIFGSLFGFAVTSLFSGADQAWGVTLVAALTIGGLALTVVLAIATYAIAALRLTKAAKIGMIIALAVGFITIPVMSVSGPQLEYRYGHNTKEVTVTVPKDKVKGAESVQIVGASAAVLIDDNEGDAVTARVVYREMVFDGTPSVSFERDGDILTVHVSGTYNKSCDIHAAIKDLCYNYGIDLIDIRGPVDAMKGIDASELGRKNLDNV